MFGDLITRRELLARGAGGLAGVAMACLLREEQARAESGGALPVLHFPAKARRVIQIFCCGGVSHLDTFDYKPELVKNDGKAMTGKGKVDTFFGQPGNLMKSPFTFQQRGQSGLWVSDLLPHLAECADMLTVVRSMTSKTSNHTPATFMMNSGFMMNGFPCLGAWLSYGLATQNEDLPAFVVLPDARGVPAGGSINWTSGFLPAAHQGVALRSEGEPIVDLQTPAAIPQARRSAEMALLQRMDRDYGAADPGDTALSARVRAYELAAKMQVSVPQVIDFRDESSATRKLYGLDNPITAQFARNCLLSRRLLERGVRFVQMYHGGAFGSPRINWDAHEDIVENHTKQAAIMDQPVAALLKDLKARGMLDDTVVLWTTEFGRTPITQGVGAKGRDHHQHGFTVWMAGAGLKPGYAYGTTDDVGYYAADNPVQVYDIHATLLRLLGIDHKRLTFYHNGIRRRLTDVHGNVIEGLLA